ncbi:glycine receptor subunit alpha-2 isoform X2 [Lepeophtheirus salmonis]|uniref:glycine receptor subunit alpha-2 isoform X2 n=1 Tax=Lepeophtheirus salmonis TaxID=72036 RepID=UPI001AE850BD|nr:glutamate-gated chloride channel alpha-like isoform X2 [Lepeophtheirus salmonis]
MLILLLFFVCAWTSPIHGAFVHERDKHLDSLRFTQNFSANDPPKLHHSPLIVEFQVNLRNVLEINELEQTISLETSIRMFWKDHRISLSKKNVPYLTFNPEYLKDAFWIPDVFVDEAKDLRSPQYQLRPSSLRVYNDSTLRFSSRVNFDIKCSMWFHRFPNDVQVCDVKLESFGYTTNEVIFKWKKSGNDVNKNISLPNFDFFIETNESYNTGSIYSLSYPGVAMKVRLSRKLTYHILQTYIPSIMLVVVSWFSLFIPIEEIPVSTRR